MSGKINSEVYDTVKRQVQQLKHEQQTLASQRAKQKEAETAALLQQKLQYEEQLYAAKEEVSSLQQRLKEHVERAARVRQHAEREHKVLLQRVNKLLQGKESQEAQHEEALAAAKADHQQQLQDAKAQQEYLQQQWEAERQDLTAKQAAFMLEVEQWSQGEVEALQAAVEARVQREQQQVLLWKHQHDEVQQQLAAAQQQVTELQQQVVQHQTDCRDASSRSCEQAAAVAVLQQQVGQLEETLLAQAQQHGREQQRWQQKLAAVEQQAHAKEHDSEARHAAELEEVHKRLHQVLMQKDRAIAQLRGDLDTTLAQLQRVTHELVHEDGEPETAAATRT